MIKWILLEKGKNHFLYNQLFKKTMKKISINLIILFHKRKKL